ncbi:hypothetical protein [Sphingomonas sp. 37zxx]|uniref:hypothetical protein n=1 Tax=Sphingomonas sp. 37zxx TaxID=1550073 RepID=UPI0012E01F63|nr:hypothetical protein [Sphingomonas sp. 37zxx]
MPTPNRETVRAILEKNDRDLKIRDAIGRAWQDVKQKYPDRAWWRRQTTLRSIMWEYSVERVMEVVEDDARLVAVKHHDTASFIADDLVFFRLKKADRKLFSSNYPTPLAGMFHRHAADLYGHEGFQRVEIVHTFDRFTTGIEWIGVVAREGKQIIWDFELRCGEAEVITFPVAPTLPAGKTVIRPNIPEVGKQADDAE